MVDDASESNGEPAPEALDAASAASPSPSTAFGASAPLDNVVSLAEAAAWRRAVEEGASTSAPPPPPPESAFAHTSGDGGSPPPEGSPSKPPKAKKPDKTIDWGRFNMLAENFALIYGTDTVWDGTQRMIMKIANMGHAHGS